MSTDFNTLITRLADKELLLDVPGAGSPEMMNCCHGGCDNCAYSHIFDSMTSGRAKWVACYPYRRLIDGREHCSPWSVLFSSRQEDIINQASSLSLTKQQFVEKFQSLPYQLTLGPSISVPADEPVSSAALEHFFSILAANTSETSKGDESEPVLNPLQVG